MASSSFLGKLALLHVVVVEGGGFGCYECYLVFDHLVCVPSPATMRGPQCTSLTKGLDGSSPAQRSEWLAMKDGHFHLKASKQPFWEVPSRHA